MRWTGSPPSWWAWSRPCAGPLPEPEDGGRAVAGFDPQWLRLRSAYDDAARSDRLTRLFSDSLPENPRLLDLAAGIGANLRYLAPRLERAGQRWVLADHDPV